MLKRTITGIIMAGFLFLVIYLTSFSHFVFDAVVLFIGAFAAYEIYSALTKSKLSDATGGSAELDNKQYNISVISLIVALIGAYPFCYFFGYAGLFYNFLIAFLCAFVIFIFDQSKHFNDFAANIVAIIYPTILLSIVFILNINYGMIPVMLAIGISTVSDAMAYFIGSALGKKKIFPKISPKKTYAGFFGGILGGAIGGIIVYLIFELGKYPTYIVFTFSSIFNNVQWLTIVMYALIGAILSVFSEIGDLAASRIKREVGLKDFGKILGSHGGIVDRIDSILFSVIAIGIIMLIIQRCVL